MADDGGGALSGKAPKYDLRTLERIKASNRQFKLPADTKAPQIQNFQRSRTTFNIDLDRAFRQAGNGLKQEVVLNRNIILEEDFFRWQQQVGKLGDPGTSRAEHMVFRSFERRGWRFPESRPPGLDVEYLARVRGNAGGIEIDFFIRSRSIAIRVQGEYWHYKDDVVTQEGIIERALMEEQGLKVVDVLAQDTKTIERTDYIVDLAMNGWEVDITGRIGIFR
ncbi:MAG: hypothetical protein ACSLE3_15695 [Microbacteriaceae bacterium]